MKIVFFLPCRLIIRYGIENGIVDLQNQKPLFTTFSKEEDLFSSKVKSMDNVTIFNLNSQDIVECNMEFNLNFIINNCLKLIEYDKKLPENWEQALDYIKNAYKNETDLEVVQYVNMSLDNLINQSLREMDLTKKRKMKK